MADTLIAWIIRQLDADSTVGGKTVGRIRKGHVRDLANPEYPLVTIARVLSGQIDPDAPASFFPLTIIAWSDKSYDEAREIAAAIKAVLHNSNGTTGGVSWCVEQSTTVVEYPDQEPAQAFAAAATYQVSQLGD